MWNGCADGMGTFAIYNIPFFPLSRVYIKICWCWFSNFRKMMGLVIDRWDFLKNASGILLVWKTNKNFPSLGGNSFFKSRLLQISLNIRIFISALVSIKNGFFGHYHGEGFCFYFPIWRIDKAVPTYWQWHPIFHLGTWFGTRLFLFPGHTTWHTSTFECIEDKVLKANGGT